MRASLQQVVRVLKSEGAPDKIMQKPFDQDPGHYRRLCALQGGNPDPGDLLNYALDMQYMEAQLARAGTPGPQVIGIDEIAIRKGHTYRIVVSDLLRGRPIWFGGDDRSEASMAQFYAWLGAGSARASGSR